MNRCALLTLAVFLAPIAAGQALPVQTTPSGEYCAFVVVVHSSKGRALEGRTVSMEDASGREYAAALTDEAGIARLCDAPRGLITLRVGGRRCGGVSVSYLQRSWLQTRTIEMVYDNCSGDDWVPAAGCLLTLRVVAADGHPIPGATILGGEKLRLDGEQTDIGDRFGRIFRFIPYGSATAFSVEKPGYVPYPMSHSCVSGNGGDIEMKIVMKPIPPQ